MLCMSIQEASGRSIDRFDREQHTPSTHSRHVPLYRPNSTWSALRIDADGTTTPTTVYGDMMVVHGSFCPGQRTCRMCFFVKLPWK